MPEVTRDFWNDRRFIYRPWTGKVVQMSALASVIWAFAAAVPAQWYALTFLAFFATSCLGFAVCVHRGLCHRAFVMNPGTERALSVFATLGMTGSPMGWIGTHRTHHAHSDRPEDPHCPGKHGWWLLWTGPDLDIDWWRIRDLMRDPFQRWLHRYYLLIVGTWIVALFATDPLILIFGFLIPAGLHVTTSNLSTILGHGYGYRTFETNDGSTNNAILALLTWGEGWHNNHHANPMNWSLSVKWWEFDLAGLCIRLMTYMGLIDRQSFREAI
jgi:stearoyl-CoA desaturase (delta-9 desaturase)